VILLEVNGTDEEEGERAECPGGDEETVGR